MIGRPKRKGLAAFAVCVSFCLAAGAGAVTIDFDNATPGVYLTADYQEDGFTADLLVGHYDFFAGGGGTGNTLFINIDTTVTGPVSTVRFSNDLGKVFDLESLDVIQASGSYATITSSKGGSILLNSTGLLNISGSDWEDIDWFDYSTTSATSPYNGIDTIKVTPVPEPGSVALMGIGAIVVSHFIRRQRR